MNAQRKQSKLEVTAGDFPTSEGTRKDFCRLLEFSLRGASEYAARQTFPMFTFGQIKRVYSIRPTLRRKLLEQRSNDQHALKPNRNPEQLLKMIQIATDPSN